MFTNKTRQWRQTRPDLAHLHILPLKGVILLFIRVAFVVVSATGISEGNSHHTPAEKIHILRADKSQTARSSYNPFEIKSKSRVISPVVTRKMEKEPGDKVGDSENVDAIETPGGPTCSVDKMGNDVDCRDKSKTVDSEKVDTETPSDPACSVDKTGNDVDCPDKSETRDSEKVDTKTPSGPTCSFDKTGNEVDCPDKSETRDSEKVDTKTPSGPTCSFDKTGNDVDCPDKSETRDSEKVDTKTPSGPTCSFDKTGNEVDCPDKSETRDSENVDTVSETTSGLTCSLDKAVTDMDWQDEFEAESVQNQYGGPTIKYSLGDFNTDSEEDCDTETDEMASKDDKSDEYKREPAGKKYKQTTLNFGGRVASRHARAAKRPKGEPERWRLTKRLSDRDTQAYRDGYPGKEDNPRLKANLLFYQGKRSSSPDGALIDDIHQDWWGNYRLLERHQGYIQWIFPIREDGMNWQAQSLQLHEAEAIRNDPKAKDRVLRSYEMMLDFYGMELKDADTGTLRRTKNWEDRYDNLSWSSHNYLRITRILKSLGELGFEHLKKPFLQFVLEEALVTTQLERTLKSCRDYWIGTVKNDADREELYRYIEEHS
ncbi:uncharacterized protein LOC101851663 [Aplysia californica]|uniref:Uncharacterized protein LOC101851663 n=1 Tax=Aplysia californica TaxID=6500 RepID=A0ABM1A655_APLCA|nr:uncharacterized protein LOC101851663 [Aplysia californica]